MLGGAAMVAASSAVFAKRIVLSGGGTLSVRLFFFGMGYVVREARFPLMIS